MSSTFAHYQGPASLPSDYAILSRYAGNHPEGHETENFDSEEDPSSSLQPPSTLRRQLSQEAYIRPRNPTMGFPDGTTPPSEITPLLNPPIPRMDEATDRSTTGGDENKVSMFWEELRILTRYSLPVFGTHLLEYTLVTVSVVTIGHLSTNALAAITLGSMTASVTGFSVIMGFSSALDTMLPSAWTSQQPQLVGLWAQRMTVVMSMCLIPMLLIWFNAETILLFLRQEPEVAHLAALYLRWVSLGLPAYAFNSISRRYFQSQGLFDVPTRIIFVIAPLNALLNYFLVWGPDPIRLGFIGAPIATAISFNLVSVLSIGYGVFFVDRRAWYPLSRRMFKGLGVLVSLGFSGVGQVASEWWAWELIGLAASLLGPTVLATQSVLLVSASTTFQAPFALGVATSVRIGNLLGEMKPKRAEVAAKTAIIMALIIAIATSTLFLVFRNTWAYMFNSDPQVVALVADILPLVALFQVFDGNAAVVAGILRSIGKQFVGALLNLSAYYIFGIPLGMYLSFSLKMGLHGLWYGLTFSLIYCSVMGTILCLRTDWEREVAKVVERLKKEDKTRQEELQADEERALLLSR